MKQYQRFYTDEEIINLVKDFINKHKREPSSLDFCADNKLPDRKTIERRYGGMRNFRKSLNLYNDHRTGSKRAITALNINQRAMEWNNKIYKILLTMFDERDIHQESSIFDDRRNRTDFKIYGKKIFLVDIFYPSNIHNLVGCVNAKMRKYPKNLRDYLDKKFDKVIFLNLNNNIQNIIKIDEDFTLMSLDEFWNYCKTMV